MSEDNRKEEEFDPSLSEDFQRNLELALHAPEDTQEEKWEPEFKEDQAFIEIGAAAEQAGKEPDSEAEESGTPEDAEQGTTGEIGETAKEDKREPEEEEELPELDFGETLFQVAPEEPEFQEKEPAEELLQGINEALAEQIEQEFGKPVYENEKKQSSWRTFFAGIPRWTRILVTVLVVILLTFGLLFGTTGGRSLVYRLAVEILWGGIHSVPDDHIDFVVSVTPVPTEEPKQGDEITPTEPIPTVAVPTGEPVEDSTVINILLLGEENLDGAIRGRTDAILIASLDKDGGPLKLVSLMRDMYVRIPGHGDRKLNAAYAIGGASLMMQTVEENFKIKLDGYVLVDFSGFENIIDRLGGLEISLTEAESRYLNRTNYISKVEERNTKPGSQKLSGSQVLGYCRVRYVNAENGAGSDFGRTYRQRLVLQKLFEKFKEKNFAELLSLMNACLGYVTAPESVKGIAAECLQVVVENRMFELDTLQIPGKGLYEAKKINKEEVLVVYPGNVDLLYDFLYRNEE